MHITPSERSLLVRTMSPGLLSFILVLDACSPANETLEQDGPADADITAATDEEPEEEPAAEEAIVIAAQSQQQSQQQRTAQVATLPDFGAVNVPSTAPAAGPTPPREVTRETSQDETRSRRRARPIRASGLFTGPGRYPPRDFAAYGILAFSSGATAGSMDRYTAICQGYVAAIPGAESLSGTGGWRPMSFHRCLHRHRHVDEGHPGGHRGSGRAPPVRAGTLSHRLVTWRQHGKH